MTIFESSRPKAPGYRFAENGIKAPAEETVPPGFRRETPAALPELSEIEVVRHYTALSRRNFAVDVGFYPLGSCTMKYNPKVNEDAAALPGFACLHPLQKDEDVQGMLNLSGSLLEALCEITGMEGGTLQSMAGAHGEYVGMKLFRALFRARGEHKRTRLLVPDSSHGTNPASAHLAGFEVVTIKSGADGLLDIAAIEPYLNDTLAGMMLTNPSTLGLFEPHIREVADRVHEVGGLLYYDGANLNAIMGKVRPGDMGFDVIHVNLHKTFSTPHGGGGPGAGPVLVHKELMPFLPAPVLVKKGSRWTRDWNRPDSIGKVSGWYGNTGVLVRAFTYMLSMGGDGLKRVSELAVLNANYLLAALRNVYDAPYPGPCKHEFVLSAKTLKETCGISASDVAKALIEHGIHPPTVYFPLIVPECLMIEPTETETRETLDNFIAVMKSIADMAQKTPDALHNMPLNTPVRRVDEVQAARRPLVSHKMKKEKTDGKP
ncbi:MAG: glycine dehydrogenase (aminomethyl-transferring) [Spirochaeta sp. LUC14_002_19_P3]|nr:MAG: glycine dehydrogenase (aminomethyl-transferring) [Spirochaeta sp. LUC14_002_19_P3]